MSEATEKACEVMDQAIQRLATLRDLNRLLVSALEAMASDVNRSDYHTRRAAFDQARAALRIAKATDL
jgi:hypothetical protein